MVIVPIQQGVACAFGLRWQVLDQVISRRKQIATLLRGGRHAANFKNGMDENFGLAQAFSPPPKTRIYSAAALFACSDQGRGRTACVVLAQESTETDASAAFIALLQGNVVVDRIVSLSEVTAELESFKRVCSEAGQRPAVFGNAEQIADISRYTWEDLFHKRRAPKNAEIRKLRQGIPKGLLIGGAVAVVAVGATTALLGHLSQQATEEEIRLREAEQDPSAVYRRALAAHMAKPVSKMRDAMPVFREALGRITPYIEGWRLEKVMCTTGSCRATWSRQHGTYSGFITRAPKEWAPFEYSPDLRTITHGVPVDIPKSKLTGPATWPTTKQFFETEGSRWQRLLDIGFKVRLKPAELVVLPPGMRPESVRALPDAMYALPWDIERGTDWFLSKAFNDAPDNIIFNSLTLEFDEKEATFMATGLAYVQK